MTIDPTAPAPKEFRQCKKCKAFKDLDEFPAYANKTDGKGGIFSGHRHTCAVCMRKPPMKLWDKMQAKAAEKGLEAVVDGKSTLPNHRIAIFYGYVRVSTSKQAKDGKSLEEQTERLTKYFEFYSKDKPGIRWGGIYKDPAVSAFKKKFADRDAGKALSERLMPGDHLAMTGMDRGFRNFRDAVNTFEDWLDRGIFMHLLDMGIASDNHIGRMILRILSVTAQFERDVRAESIRHAQAKVKRDGRNPKAYLDYGWKLTGKKGSYRFLPDYEERENMLRVAHLIENEGLSIERTAWRLHEDRVRNTRRLKLTNTIDEDYGAYRWNFETVKKMYKSFKENPTFKQVKYLRSLGLDPDNWDHTTQPMIINGEPVVTQ